MAGKDSRGDAPGNIAGFSLHAGVAVKLSQREKLERLCRYICRPPVSEKRLFLTPRGYIGYSLKTPYRDGTTHVIFEPLDFIARLAALVPPPRQNLTRFHGVFAPNSPYRARITPAGRGRGQSKLTKKGDPEVRRLLFNAAMQVRRSPVWKPYYLALRERGFSTTAAFVALGRKLARVTFALLQKQAVFRPKNACSGLTEDIASIRGLELHPDKARLIEFGRFAGRNRKARGQGKPESFDFLGFTHFCAGRRGDGSFSVRRHTIAARQSVILARSRQWLMRNRCIPVHDRVCRIRRMLAGLIQYYGAPWMAFAVSSADSGAKPFVAVVASVRSTGRPWPA